MGSKVKLVKLALNNAVKLCLQKASSNTGLDLSKPTSIFISITNRCNLRCTQCDVPALGDRNKELSTEQWKEVLKELHNWLGIAVLRWSGGEPFLRDDMLELLSYGTDLGMLSSIISNGQLIDRDMASRIVDSGVFNVSLSTDGMQSGHDHVRGQGTFEKVTAAARFLNETRKAKNSSMKIIIKLTVMETNLDEIIDLVDWVEKEGLDGISISSLLETLATSSPDHNWFEKNPLWVRDMDKLDRVMDELVDRVGRGSSIINPQSYLAGIKEYFRNPTVPMPEDFTCHVGHDHFRIDPNGDVYLCPLITNALVGNVARNTPRQIWTSPEAEISRKEIYNCRKNCLVACQHKRNLRENMNFFLKLFR